MSERRPEPFVVALSELRARLQRGEIALDRRMAATEIAGELGLSATPVREALSRLAGEGLLEDRRGEGFFVRRLRRIDIAALYRLCLANLSLAMELGSEGDGADAARPPQEGLEDPVAFTERLFAVRATASGSRALALTFFRLQAQLAPARRLERRLLDDLEGEARDLLAAWDDHPEWLRRLRAFHGRRVRLAGRLADLLEEGGGSHPL